MTGCVIGLVFFLFNDQGQDFLRRLVDSPGRWMVLENTFFLLATAAWGFSSWYCARLMLTRRFPHTDPSFFSQTRLLRIWLPRIVGGLNACVVAVGFIVIKAWQYQGLIGPVLVALHLALGAAMFVFFWKRRSIFRASFAGQMADDVNVALPPSSQRALMWSFAISWGLLLSMLALPVTIATVFGAPAIALFAVASWILFGSIVLTYWPLTHGFPPLTLAVFLFAIAASWINDDHGVRSAATAREPAPRMRPEDHFNQWLQVRLQHAPGNRTFPVFVVATSGGGIRAAYWTASVLGHIADQNPDWADHLYAISGVSGGSVGGALHAAQIADQKASRGQFESAAQASLSRDLLSPMVAYLLFPDLVQRFLPFPVPAADRARALESAFESAAADRSGAASDRFKQRFVELWPKDEPYRVPVLLLNTTVVETGERALVSPLTNPADEFPGVVDVLRDSLAVSDLPLSSAAHLSARFAYVSPAATVRNNKGELWGHLVDGGYFENSGTVTAIDLMRIMDGVINDSRGKHPGIDVAVSLILIRNDPEAPALCTKGSSSSRPPSRGLNELLSPVNVLMSTRVARGQLAERNAVQYMRLMHRGGPQSERCERGCVFEFGLAHVNRDPPLGWSLSQTAAQGMKDHLADPYIQSGFACIRGMLDGNGCQSAPACGKADKEDHG